jgi:hypothetical protein
MTDFERGYRQGQADYFRWVKTFSGGKPNYVIPPETPEVTPYVTPDDRGSTGEVPGKLEIPEREEFAGKPTNGEAQLPNGKAMTREDIIRMAIDAGATGCANPDKWGILEISYENLERLVSLAVLQEREECAKIANAWQTDVLNPQYHCDCATAIRARGEK